MSREPKVKPVSQKPAAPAPLPGDIAARWPVLALAILTFALTLPLFAPWSVWPLGYIVFVPWLVGACLSRRRTWVFISSYLLGMAFFFTHWRWLYSTTPEGYFAGSIAFGLYFPLAAWVVRHFWRQRGISPAFSFPIIWILVEMARSRGPLAFPWFLLGHSQIRLLSLVQLADITGVYGISFVLAIVNGWLVSVILSMRTRRKAPAAVPPLTKGGLGGVALSGDVPVKKGGLFAPTAFTLAALATLIIYGQWRLRTLPTVEGPRVAVVQGDYLLSPVDDPHAPTDTDKQRVYFSLLREAAATQPDMFVMPETPWFMYLNRELRELPPERLADLSRNEHAIAEYYIAHARIMYERFREFAIREGAYLLVGAMSNEKRPRTSYPPELRFNSAFLLPPDGSEATRYDKIHLVLFGEYVPFRFTAGLHWFYTWMNSITPWGADGREYSLAAGSDWQIFTMHRRGLPEQPYHFGVTICYEDVIPQVFRKFTVDAAGRKRIDFMLNISNDGWFGHGDQQGQHLVNCAFRAIENRVGIARAVNTGISGFIAPDGRWYDLVGNGPKMDAGGIGTRTAVVHASPATTFYSRHGDIFGLICAILGLAAIADAAIISPVTRRRG